ncbi:uncharacterized protein LOC110373272 [Helicoverpa armigera]|uniref:uncharacterized protein LOC110373272 n=1 Tax=Helicoverpa armigera TaxID=29058 RepID=UPI003082B341
MDSAQSILDDSFTAKLIDEIEKRPPLYNNNLRAYADVYLKKILWEEICEEVIPQWNQLSSETKTKTGRDLQNKWANLRTCFRRELNAQKNPKSGQASTKRRQYIYFQQLLFLLPYVGNQKNESSKRSDDTDNAEDDEEAGTSRFSIPSRKKPKMESNKYVDEVLNEAQKNNEMKIDADTNFALSLVPSLQKLTDEEKIDAKIAILKVFKNTTEARYTNTLQAIPQSTNSHMMEQPMSSFQYTRSSLHTFQ